MAVTAVVILCLFSCSCAKFIFMNVLNLTSPWHIFQFQVLYLSGFRYLFLYIFCDISLVLLSFTTKFINIFFLLDSPILFWISFICGLFLKTTAPFRFFFSIFRNSTHWRYYFRDRSNWLCIERFALICQEYSFVLSSWHWSCCFSEKWVVGTFRNCVFNFFCLFLFTTLITFWHTYWSIFIKNNRLLLSLKRLQGHNQTWRPTCLCHSNDSRTGA